MSPLLAVALALSPAHAAQTLQGDALTVYYDDEGNWISDADEACIQAYLGSEWIEFAWWGSPFQRWMVDFTQDSTSYNVVLDSESTDDITVVSESDISTSTEMGSVYEYTYGDLSIIKTETWDKTGAVMLVHFEFSNTGSTDISDIVFNFEFDPDQDQDESEGGGVAVTAARTLTNPTFETNNDVQDPDGDGTSEWVQSVGDESGYTVGFLACDPGNSELGHYEDWPSSPGFAETLTDFEGAAGDNSMVLRLIEGRTLAAGGTIVTSLLVSFAETEADALANAQADAGLCETCDTDGDGSDNAICGGDDCDDADASAYPSAPETWYDGVDSDCAGDSDYDADGDGSDRDLDGGDDCDDADATVYPGAPDAWYDGVDSDCRGNDDYDADGDGFPLGEEPGQDCDDEDDSVNPDAAEIWYDGVDQDCQRDSDFDADGDGFDSDQYGGEDCDDSDPDLVDDCGGDDGGGDDGGGDGGGDDGGGDDTGGDDTGDDDGDDDDDDDDKTVCASAGGSSSLALALLGGVVVLGARRRRD